jgi:hypothetical protein
MTCPHDEPELLPYRPNTVEDPSIARLKRIIALKDAELACYRELVPGLKFYPKHGILMDPDQLPMDEP